MKKILLLFAGLMLIACNDNDDSVLLSPQEQGVNFNRVGKGNLYGNSSENITQQNLVINTEAEWNALKAAMDASNNTTYQFTETEINFDEYQVLAVFDAVKMNGGWTIDILDIAETQDNILVNLDNVRKGDATTVITQPFEIVKIKRTDKAIVFD
ncbi:protease complex subunit PrcB family protein [Flavobacterium cerinum]|uniref:Protease complex subunit PrcB family protein n=1 Tax=Flavobacterium cerinum TaxID=2502784 RepID=A0ABY5IRH4_9FLAO|nr:protease complex subunit PrcB family protein [Flavobacterium cerinum]UUC45239.1 protease complex subunit PrcB family protein [Flavobacterium cerinum]